jgi:hypothetical protein
MGREKEWGCVLVLFVIRVWREGGITGPFSHCWELRNKAKGDHLEMGLFHHSNLGVSVKSRVIEDDFVDVVQAVLVRE